MNISAQKGCAPVTVYVEIFPICYIFRKIWVKIGTGDRKIY